MFRLVFLTFHGSRASASHDRAVAGHVQAGGGGPHDQAGHPHAGHGGHLHDAPPAMAIVLVLLAVGSVAAGYVGVPAVLGGSNHIEHFLEPSFRVPGADHGAEASHAEARAETALGGEAKGEGGLTSAGEVGHAPIQAGDAAHEDHATELGLMAFSSGIAVAGIGIAAYFFLRRKDAADRLAASFAGVHRVLLNKYYVDELYDAAIVQPIKRISERALWRVFDAGVIDGAVNGTGSFVNGASAILRRLQTGSMRAYALSVFVGVVLILGYYVWR
jgi:NADH-quinone oxidoreductase subunit L